MLIPSYSAFLRFSDFAWRATIAKILDEYDKNGDLSELSIKKIKAMCNPRYLGNLYIKEFPDPYKWWNFLAEIKKSIE